MHNETIRLSYDVNNYSDHPGCYPPRPSALVDNTLLDLHKFFTSYSASFNTCLIDINPFFIGKRQILKNMADKTRLPWWRQCWCIRHDDFKIFPDNFYERSLSLAVIGNTVLKLFNILAQGPFCVTHCSDYNGKNSKEFRPPPPTLWRRLAYESQKDAGSIFVAYKFRVLSWLEFCGRKSYFFAHTELV